jgi:hypothetical protein
VVCDAENAGLVAPLVMPLVACISLGFGRARLVGGWRVERIIEHGIRG